MTSSYKVAFIGCGKRAHHAARGVLADPRCEIAGLADINPEAAKTLCETFEFEAPIYEDHRAMIAAIQPDVVVGSLWTPLHLPVFRDCAEAGVKAFLSEKPMAPSWGESMEMGEIAEKTGCILTFCHQRRFSKGNRQVRQWLKEGKFGEIMSMDLYSPCGLLDCGTHSIDQAMSFNNETPARWVMGGADVSEMVENFGIPTETMFAGLIHFENGVRANIQCKGPDRDMPTGVRVHATNGMIEVGWGGEIGRCHVFDDPGWKPTVFEKDDPGATMEAVVSSAIDGLEQGKEPELSYKNALRATEVIFALYESAATRKRVELPLSVRENLFTRQFPVPQS